MFEACVAGRAASAEVARIFQLGWTIDRAASTPELAVAMAIC